MSALLNARSVEVINQFSCLGKLSDIRLYGSGHINETYRVELEQNHAKKLYILQKVNHSIFKNTDEMMQNIFRVTEFLRHKKDSFFKENLVLIPTKKGEYYLKENGEYWRLYNFIEGGKTYNKIENTLQAYSGANAFGFFQKELAQMPGGDLHETLPDFHNTVKRYDDFCLALSLAPKDIVLEAQYAIEQAQQLSYYKSILVDAVSQGDLPKRVCHNDTKLNNVVLNSETQKGLCVIDLDTLMTGTALYDFGDYIRTAAREGEEDEADLTKVHFRQDMYQASLEGYLDAIGDTLVEKEKELLASSALIITYEIGLRFLSDFLEGNKYFKVQHPRHNLDRALVQFKIALEIEAQLEQLNKMLP